MWKKYGCSKYKFNPDDRKVIGAISAILGNKVVNTVIYTFLTIIQKFAVVGENITPLILELYKIFAPKKLENKTEKKAPVIFDVMISIFRILNASTVYITRADKRIKEINPDSSLIQSILEIRFTGDFEEFEASCDKIIDKELINYSAEDIAILWLTLADCLQNYSNDGELSLLSTSTIFGNSLQSYIDQVSREEVGRDKRPFTISEKGEVIYTGTVDDRNRLYQEITNEFNMIQREFPFAGAFDYDPKMIVTFPANELIGFKLEYLNIYGILRNTNNLSVKTFMNTSDKNTTMIIIMIGILLSYLKSTRARDRSYSNSKTMIGRLTIAELDKLWGQQPNVIPSMIDQEVDDIIDVINRGFENLPMSRSLRMGNTVSRFIYSFLPRDVFERVRAKEKLAEIEETVTLTESAKKLSAQKTLQFNQVSAFYGMTNIYSTLKFIFNNILPRRLVTIMFDLDSSYSFYDEVLSIAAGVLLGPKYLAETTSGESAGEIVDEYLKTEFAGPDPFITKYMEENKFIEEKKTEKFNVFITNKDFVELQKEVFEDELKERAKREKITGGIRLPRNYKGNIEKLSKRYEHIGTRNLRSQYRAGSVPGTGDMRFEVEHNPLRARVIKLIGNVQVPVDETTVDTNDAAIKNKVHELFSKNSAIIDDVINSDTKDFTTNERIAILTGMFAGDALDNDLSPSLRGKVHKLLCYISSNLATISRTRHTFLVLLLASTYMMNKTNNIIIGKYEEWSKRTGKSTIREFAATMRYSQQKSVLQKLI